MNDKMKLKQWKEITGAKLKDLYYEQNLSDRSIAELYGVTKNQIRYKLNKFDISIKNKIFNEFISQSSEVYIDLSNDSKARLLKHG